MGVMLRRALQLASLVALVAVAGCSGHGAVKQDVGGSLGYQQGNLALDFVAVGHRHAPGRISGSLLDGSPFDPATLRGKVVVLNWWESDCGPCQAEAQAFQQLYLTDRRKGVEFLGIDIRDGRAEAQAFERRWRITYPSLFDPSNLLALQFRSTPPLSTPTTLVLDRTGRVAARQSGEIYYSQLRDLVDRVLAESA
jgi:peroxiredoxin